jgi:hypothetical protein
MEPVETTGGAASERVLADLASLVEAMAAATQSEAAILEQLVSGHKTYVAAVRAILVGGEIPPEPNPGEGGEIAASTTQAVEATNRLGTNVAAMTGALAERASMRAKELDAVKNKEQEEKKGTPPRTPPKTPDAPAANPPPPGKGPPGGAFD